MTTKANGTRPTNKRLDAAAEHAREYAAGLPRRRRRYQARAGIPVRTVSHCIPIALIDRLDSASDYLMTSRSELLSRALERYLDATADGRADTPAPAPADNAEAVQPDAPNTPPRDSQFRMF